MITYLYIKTHKITGLKYLGKTTQDPFNYKGSGVRWLHHLNKHGKEHYTEILMECQSNEEVKQWGLHYSELYNVVESPEWANLKPENGDGGSVIHTEETRAKISASNKAGMTPERRAKISEAARNISPETRAKMSAAKKNLSPETRAKLSAAARNISPETRAKLSAAKKGKTLSPETRAKLSAAARNISPETRAKLSEAKKGKTLSPEHRAKLSAAARNISPETRAKMSEAKKAKVKSPS